MCWTQTHEPESMGATEQEQENPKPGCSLGRFVSCGAVEENTFEDTDSKPGLYQVADYPN